MERHRFTFFVILLSGIFATALGAPSALSAERNEFFSCVDRDGRVTITNRHYDEALYTCTPFAKLNRSFKQAGAGEKNNLQARQETPRAHAAGKEREETAAVEAARISAESARTAMEAAHIAAQAARSTAEASAAIAPPYQIIRER